MLWILLFYARYLVRYMVLEYCVGVLQDMLEHAPNKKFPDWQTHGFVYYLLLPV